MRSKKEIEAYETEAFEKVWLMRTDVVEANERISEESARELEARRLEAVERVLNTYDDIPEEYDDWDCGFWNGVLGTLRWVLGEESKTFLDT